MNKIFLFDNYPRTSEDCNKSSRSVSYETLVGGTTTAGSAYEQTQCLSKVCAGYRFCKTMRFSYENLVDKLLQMSSVFKLGKIIGLIAVLSMCIISESRAVNCDAGKKVCGTGCISESLACNGCGTNCYYTQVGGDVTLYGTGAVAGGLPQNSSPFYNNKSITSVTADSTSNFTSIAESAFRNATSLQSVDLPNVTTIGNDAFAVATSLQSVNMPNVTTIGNEAFTLTTSLQSIDLPNVETIGYFAFRASSSLESINMPNVTSIDYGAFMDASSLRSADMPNVTTIEREVFYNASSLESVNMPNVGTIGDAAFLYANSLSQLEIPETLEHVGYLAFATESDLTLIIPDQVNIDDWDSEAFSTGEAYNVMIKCEGNLDICKDNMKKFIIGDGNQGYCTDAEGCLNANMVSYGTAIATIAPSDCYANGQVFYQNACVDEYPFAKKHWTPAEAAQYLKDTDNEIIMTFKVNR